MRWSRVIVSVAVLVSLLLLLPRATSSTSLGEDATRQQHVTGGFYERALQELVLHRRAFLDGFGNGTAALEGPFAGDDDDDEDERSKATAEGEGRGRRKRLRQMNRTLMAMVMAFALKFMFLIPTFIGTLILLKFTTGLAGFFYALFAAVLGLDHQHEH